MMLSADELVGIIVSLDRQRLARLAWRAASADKDAAVGVEVESGELAILTAPAGSGLPEAPGVILLRHCPAWRRSETEKALRAATEVPPSPEVIEETATRDGARRPLFWSYIDEQLEALERRSA